MRALMISPAMPAKTGGGLSMRMGLFLDALTAVAKTDVLVLPLGGLPKEQASLDDRFSASCRIISMQGREDTLFKLVSRIADPAQRLDAFRSYGRSSLSANLSAAVLADIAKATKGQSYDLVHVGRTYLAEAGLAVADTRAWTLDADENDALMFRRRAALNAASGDHDLSAFNLAEAEACERQQRATLGHYDLVFASSEQEAQSLRPSSSGKPVNVIPNAVALPASPHRLDDGGTLLFVGSLGFWPNKDGLLWFVQEVWPELQSRAKRALRFLIVGRDCPVEILKLASTCGISVHADAADLEEFYNQATLAIVPLRAGGGTRIKIIEAALYGVPVVSTRIGAEGLSFVDGRDIWLADDAEAMTDQILLALDNPARARDFGARAQALAVANYGYDTVCNQLACIWRDLLAKERVQL